MTDLNQREQTLLEKDLDAVVHEREDETTTTTTTTKNRLRNSRIK